MEQKTSIASGIEIIQESQDYDAACKRILSEKIILAWILKSCVAEFKDFDIQFIAEKCIEGDPQVAIVPIAPDETGPMIRGRNTEQSSSTENTFTFDIIFDAIVPGTDKVIRLIINVEPQDDFYPGYPLPKRGIYYISRMISSQAGTIFEHSDYGKLRKAVSIWICTNPPKKRQNTITCYEMKERNVVGEDHEAVENYDLITLVMIHLGAEDGKNYNGVLKLLGTLLTSNSSLNEKERVLKDEFHIPMTRTINREVSLVSTFLQSVEERGVQKGHDQGYEEGILNSLKLLIKNTGWPAEKAMITLEIPQNQRKKYADMMNGN